MSIPSEIVDKYTAPVAAVGHAARILRLIEGRRHNRDLWLTEVKTGPTNIESSEGLRRLDGLALARSWTRPCITGYEVKISRSDFLRDNKWPEYLKECHEFYFACPPNLIRPDELPEDVGLLWVDVKRQVISTKRKAKHRAIDLPPLLLYYIAINRLDGDRYPFFNSREEYFRAQVEHREERRELGALVTGRIGDRLRELEGIERRLEAAEQQLRAIREIAKKHGLNVFFLPLEIDKAIGSPDAAQQERTQRLRRQVGYLEDSVKRLREELGQDDPETPCHQEEGAMVVTVTARLGNLEYSANYRHWARRVFDARDLDLGLFDGHCLKGAFVNWGEGLVIEAGQFLVLASEHRLRSGRTEFGFALVGVAENRAQVIPEDEIAAAIEAGEDISAEQRAVAARDRLYRYALYCSLRFSRSRPGNDGSARTYARVGFSVGDLTAMWPELTPQQAEEILQRQETELCRAMLAAGRAVLEQTVATRTGSPAGKGGDVIRRKPWHPREANFGAGTSVNGAPARRSEAITGTNCETEPNGVTY